MKNNNNNNCNVLGTGDKVSDHDHVLRLKPLALKKRELANDPTKVETDRERSANTTKLRNHGDARPLGGNK